MLPVLVEQFLCVSESVCCVFVIDYSTSGGSCPECRCPQAVAVSSWQRIDAVSFLVSYNK